MSGHPPETVILGRLPNGGGQLAFASPATSVQGKGDQMGRAIKIRRTRHTAEPLREFAAKSSDGAQRRCLLAIAVILRGRACTLRPSLRRP